MSTDITFCKESLQEVKGSHKSKHTHRHTHTLHYTHTHTPHTTHTQRSWKEGQEAEEEQGKKDQGLVSHTNRLDWGWNADNDSKKLKVEMLKRIPRTL